MEPTLVLKELMRQRKEGWERRSVNRTRHCKAEGGHVRGTVVRERMGDLGRVSVCLVWVGHLVEMWLEGEVGVRSPVLPSSHQWTLSQEYWEVTDAFGAKD